jgi:DNA topoisomerase-1
MTESTVTLDEALKLLNLPRELGTHPESGQPVLAGLGRFGPYVKHGDDFRSLTDEDDVFTVGLERALALFAQPKRSARRQAAKRVIRQIEAPDGGKPLQVLEGRYGPYVSDGETNASVPRGTDPNTITLEEARGLIEARRGAPPRERRTRSRARAGQGPRGPQVPQVPKVTKVPRVPQVQEMGDARKHAAQRGAKAPKAPRAAKAPEALKAPHAAKALPPPRVVKKARKSAH